MKSICWTDHANFTKQQVAEEIDVKHLRWVSEIIQDGSQIRSLSGRAAKLRRWLQSQPCEQGSDSAAAHKGPRRSLWAAVAGLRSGRKFLSDWQDSRYPVPWTMPSDAIPDPPAVGMIVAMSRVAPKLRAVYVSDYVGESTRVALTSKLWLELSQLLPGWELSMATVCGPFEDDAGEAFAHFAPAVGHCAPAKVVLDTKKDLLTSVVQVLRGCVMHSPRILIGDGQGALVCLALTRPLLIETALGARNVQREEAHAIANAWGELRAVVVSAAQDG